MARSKTRCLLSVGGTVEVVPDLYVAAPLSQQTLASDSGPSERGKTSSALFLAPQRHSQSCVLEAPELCMWLCGRRKFEWVVCKS
jgi:hypothetical protein